MVHAVHGWRCGFVLVLQNVDGGPSALDPPRRRMELDCYPFFENNYPDCG